MKKRFIVNCIIATAIIMVKTMPTIAQQNDFQKLSGPYLGQKPPGLQPEIFAPGIISHTDYFEHSATVFSPDGEEVYWASIKNDNRYAEIYFMKMINGKWSERQIAPFSKKNTNSEKPVFSPDGNSLFFTAEDDIWIVHREGENWGEPSKINQINSNDYDQIACVTNNGNLYFIRIPEFKVFISHKFGNGYSSPKELAIKINNENYRKMDLYVSPDESYLILEASKDEATCELFVSYRNMDGKWSDCKKLPIKWGRFPTVSPDGKYLFFMTREGVYWISAKIIEELKNRKS